MALIFLHPIDFFQDMIDIGVQFVIDLLLVNDHLSSDVPNRVPHRRDFIFHRRLQHLLIVFHLGQDDLLHPLLVAGDLFQ